MQKQFDFEYLEFDDVNQLQDDEQALLREAIEAAKGAYCPYSNYSVGAAIAMDNGAVVKGANQENGAYPSGLCAERTAAFYASSIYPDDIMRAIAVVACNGGKLVEKMFYPCGACRQVLMEYENKGGKPIKVIVASGSKINVFPSVKSLLPFSFEM